MLVLVFLLSGYQAHEKTASLPLSMPPDDDETVEAYVTKITDGDTIRVQIGQQDEIVRLLSVNAPEYTDKKEPYGREAKQFLKRLLLHDKVLLEFDIQLRDRYGRLLAYVYCQGESIQKQLLKQGLAEVRLYPPNLRHEQEYRQYEKMAQSRQLNIWSY